jgi:hypothetical protein
MNVEHDLAIPDSEGPVLRPDAMPTASYEDDQDYHKHIATIFKESESVRPPTESDVLGPYFRRGAPYRAKVTPPHEPGTTLLVSGRMKGLAR